MTPQHPPSLLRIRPRRRLSREFQRLRRVLFRHVQLHKLQVRRRREIPVVEEVLCFLLGLHGVGFGFAGVGAEDGDEVFVFPFLDVIVGGVHAVDVALDRVAFVAD